MGDTLVDEVVSNGSPAARPAPRVIETVEGDRGRMVATSPTASDDQIEGAGVRTFSDSVKEKLTAIRESMRAARAAEHATEEDDPDAPPGETSAEAAAAAGDGAKPAAAAPAKPADPAPAVAPPVVAADAGEVTRYRDANTRLLAELDAERKKPRESEAMKPLADASRTFLENSMASMRAFIAHSLGVAHDAPEVDAELEAIKIDLTSKDLGVTPNPAYQAQRDAARAKQLWARERSERKAGEESASETARREAEARSDADAAATVASKLSATTDYPLLTSLSTVFDGMPAGALIQKVIQRETQTGRLDPKTHSHDQMVATAARLVEDYYKSQLPNLQTLIAKATTPSNPNPSTASPSGQSPPAATQSARQASQSSPARTLTTADASVAPATPPATKPKAKDATPKTFKNDDERKKWALRHLRSTRPS